MKTQDIFEDTPGQLPAVFLVTEPVIFNETSGHPQPRLWQPRHSLFFFFLTQMKWFCAFT